MLFHKYNAWGKGKSQGGWKKLEKSEVMEEKNGVEGLIGE